MLSEGKAVLDSKAHVSPDTTLPTEPKIHTTWPPADGQPEICLNPALTEGEPGRADSRSFGLGTRSL